MKKKLLFLLLIIIFSHFIPMHAFVINRAIVSSDNNPMYLDFWPIVAAAWKKLGIKPTLALIATADVQVDETIGDVIRFEPIEGIPTGLQAQLIRLLLPIYFEEDVSLISDIDMIPLNKDYFVNAVEDISDDFFVVYRDKAYHPAPRFPMCYNAAKGSVFKAVFNTSIEDIPTRIIEWYHLGLGWDTDEFVLYQYVSRFDKHTTLGHSVGPRVDRTAYKDEEWHYNIKKLKNNYYLDCHSIRPYKTYKILIDTLLREALIEIPEVKPQNLPTIKKSSQEHCHKENKYRRLSASRINSTTKETLFSRSRLS